MSSLICGGHTSSHKLRPGAITSAFHRQSGKYGHLLYVGGGILSGKRLFALDTIQSISSGFVCMALVYVVHGASVCACVSESQKEESLSGIVWHWAGTLSDKYTSLQAYLPD